MLIVVFDVWDSDISLLVTDKQDQFKQGHKVRWPPRKFDAPLKSVTTKKLAVARSRGCIIKNQIIGITYYKLVLREKPRGCSGFDVEKYGGRWKTGSPFKFFIMATMKVCVHNSWFITLITVNTIFCMYIHIFPQVQMIHAKCNRGYTMTCFFLPLWCFSLGAPSSRNLSQNGQNYLMGT